MRQAIDGSTDIRKYYKAILEKQGKDFYTCEFCGIKSKKKLDIHHTKYNGATINDLKIVCRKCNLNRNNCFLQ